MIRTFLYLAVGLTVALHGPCSIAEEKAPEANKPGADLPFVEVNVKDRYVDLPAEVCLDDGLLELVATVHPSYLLRIRDEADKREQYRRFVRDLRLAA